MKNTFCFAISRKDGQYKWFDLRYNPYETQNVNIILEPSTISEIRNKLRTYGVNNDLEARLNKVEEQIVLLEKLRIIQLEQIEKYKEHLKLMAIKSEQIKKENQIKARLRSVAFLCESKPIESGQQWFR